MRCHKMVSLGGRGGEPGASHQWLWETACITRFSATIREEVEGGEVEVEGG